MKKILEMGWGTAEGSSPFSQKKIKVLFACPGILQNTGLFYKLWPSARCVKLDWPQSVAHLALPSTLTATETIRIASPDMLAVCPLSSVFLQIRKYARGRLEECPEGQAQSGNSGHVWVGAEPPWGPKVEKETLGRHLLYM